MSPENDAVAIYRVALEKDYVRASIVPHTPEPIVADLRTQLLALSDVAGVRICESGPLRHFEILPAPGRELEKLGLKVAELLEVPAPRPTRCIIHPTLKGRRRLTCIVAIFERPHEEFMAAAKTAHEFYELVIGAATIEFSSPRCFVISMDHGDAKVVPDMVLEGVRFAQLNITDATHTDYVSMRLILQIVRTNYAE